MAAQQSTLRGHLSLLGIAKADVASNPQDAVRLIKSRRYGLILCDYNLNQKTDGQQVFEYLRDNDLLPLTACFHDHGRKQLRIGGRRYRTPP